VYIAWAERNRPAAVRIPQYKPSNEVAARMEIRFPDPTCNPYLAFSVMLSAGLDGVENKTQVPDPVTMDLYELSAVEREESGIASLPHHLYDAVQVAEHSPFLKVALGDHVHEKLVERNLAEIDKFRLHVWGFDLQEHLKL
jgi:glutamine synthetase